MCVGGRARRRRAPTHPLTPLSVAGRSHLAEFFDEDDAEGDTMDTERLGLKDFLDCGHAFGSCDCDD